MAAHPQRNTDDADLATLPDVTVKNPFPTQMTVPDAAGNDVVLDLAVVGDTLYAPNLDDHDLHPDVRQYVTVFCSVWSGSVVTSGKLQPTMQERPRRGQIVLEEANIHAMLGLAPDERLLRVFVDDRTGSLRFVVESPRLPQQPYWSGEPPYVKVPIAAYYEQPQS